MANNQIFDVPKLSVVCTHPAAPSSGNPVRFGELTGVALIDEDADGNTTVDFRTGLVYDLSVKGVDDSGNSAVAVGENLYYVDADINDGTGFLSKKQSGRYFGIALEIVATGTTVTIQVIQHNFPGQGDADIPALDGANLADVADDAVVGGIPVIHRVTIPSGADGDVDITLTHKTKVLDAFVQVNGAGTAGSLITVKNGATAISDALDISAAGDTDIVRVGEIDDAAEDIAAAGTLRVSKASTGGDIPACKVTVLGIRVA